MRNLIEMSWPEVDALDKKSALVVMPIGSVEQHGHHLPVGTDYLLAAFFADSLKTIECEGVILPPLQYGLNPEHMDFTGTITLSPETLLAILREQTDSFYRRGFRKFVFLNAHGGNTDLLHTFIRCYRSSHDCSMISISYLSSKFFAGQKDLFENHLGMDCHAGEFETSMMLFAYPKLVNLQQDISLLRECNIPVSDLPSGWISSEISKSGVIGDATLASEEKGAAFCDFIKKKLKATILEFSREK